MSRLICIVGVTGVGKTTLVRSLCAAGKFTPGLEEHQERPFQLLFKNDSRHALANQFDYLLLRAEQEMALRQAGHKALMDGGLEMDFHGFTKLFHEQQLISREEFSLCERLYQYIRTNLPLPDLFIHLSAEKDVIKKRLENRQRINIATTDHIMLLDDLIKDWLATLPAEHIKGYDVSEDDPGYQKLTPAVLNDLQQISNERWYMDPLKV